MAIFNEQHELITDPDLSLGYLERVERTVYHVYVQDAEEQGHWEVVAEYPNGGKDEAWVVDTPAMGHWEIQDEAGDPVEHYDGFQPEPDFDGFDKDQRTPDLWEVGVYHPYTDEQLEQIAADAAALQAASLHSVQVETAAALFVRSAALPRAQAVSVSTLYGEWSGDGVAYSAGDWVRYGGDLYRVEQAHASQESWTPDAAPSLFTRIRLAPDGIRIWEKPTHAENSFDLGEPCHHPGADGPVWESLMDGNIVEPGTDSRYWKERA